jgi:hypothetical protein
MMNIVNVFKHAYLSSMLTSNESNRDDYRSYSMTNMFRIVNNIQQVSYTSVLICVHLVGSHRSYPLFTSASQQATLAFGYLH